MPQVRIQHFQIASLGMFTASRRLANRGPTAMGDGFLLVVQSEPAGALLLWKRLAQRAAHRSLTLRETWIGH